jgi:hypothetical protein
MQKEILKKQYLQTIKRNGKICILKEKLEKGEQKRI